MDQMGYEIVVDIYIFKILDELSRTKTFASMIKICNIWDSR